MMLMEIARLGQTLTHYISRTNNTLSGGTVSQGSLGKWVVWCKGKL